MMINKLILLTFLITGSSCLFSAPEGSLATTTPSPADPVAQQSLAVPASTPYGLFAVPNIGTLGVGLEVGYDFNPYFTLRGRANWIGVDFDKDRQDINYQAKAENVNGGLLLDYRPWAGSFHLSAGLLVSNLNARAEGSTHDQRFTLGGNTFVANGTVDVRGKYTWNKVQPYVGLGWSTPPSSESSWYVSADIGIAFLGSGKLKTSSSGKITDVEGNPVNNTIVDESMRQEAADVLEVCDHLRVYPVVQIGVGYRF